MKHKFADAHLSFAHVLPSHAWKASLIVLVSGNEQKSAQKTPQNMRVERVLRTCCTTSAHAADEDDLGRLSMRETVEPCAKLRCASANLCFIISPLTFRAHSKVRSTSRHAISYVSPLPYSRSIFQ